MVGRIAGPSMGGVLLDSLNSGALVFTIIGGIALLAIPSFYLSNRLKKERTIHAIIQSD
ncbi:hypothetical protein [Psychrobacillus soli]|uniref:hypothetical protein n=1 Tax=Psychrobacillus soli TaxID=1543965 RepID=UPI00163C2806|nr:hypothetical protein [Psychrobacillus soli]